MVLCRLMTVCFLIIHCFLAKYNAAILKSSSLTPINYDQKQTGEYNVRLHLKDFQIIAILGEDVLSSLNDDYEEIDYQIPEEYLDIQVPTTQNSTPTSSSTALPTTTVTITKKPLMTSTSTTLPPRRTVTTRITTRKPEIYTPTSISSTTKVRSTTDYISTTKKLAATTSSSIKNITNEHLKNITKTPTKKVEDGTLPADKIPVVVIQENSSRGLNKKPNKIVSASVAIVTPNEELRKNSEPHLILGEILHYKKCPQGYSRDKSGRCRKIRRQQPVFDVSRFSSNLATRFKYSTSTEKQS